MARKKRGQSREARWNIARLVASFGGIAPLIEAHASLGFDRLRHGRISQWQRRGSIPSNSLAEILLALKEQRRCNVWEYIITGS